MGVSTQTIAKTGETIYYSDGSKVSKSVYESAKERESTVQRYQSPSGKRVSVGRESIGGKEVAVVVGSPEAIEEVAPSRKKSSVQKYVTPYGRSVSVGRETIGGRDVEIAVGSPKAISEVILLMVFMMLFVSRQGLHLRLRVLLFSSNWNVVKCLMLFLKKREVLVSLCVILQLNVFIFKLLVRVLSLWLFILLNLLLKRDLFMVLLLKKVFGVRLRLRNLVFLGVSSRQVLVFVRLLLLL